MTFANIFANHVYAVLFFFNFSFISLAKFLTSMFPKHFFNYLWLLVPSIFVYFKLLDFWKKICFQLFWACALRDAV